MGLVLLAISFTETELPDFPAPGMTAYAVPWFTFLKLRLDGAAGEAGAGEYHLPFRVFPELEGLTVHHWALIPDPGSPTGWSSSNALAHSYEAADPTN